ncbi:hypothetical protein PACTADRAFT_33899 [Pachysolen tannophilus NRRL Y-2460]|uniref:Thiol-specific monooxygenase n=1 Tax=Pachysolen tannophilus NRRL Y-2460 TaxID=669874 RepID=A0A1E4TUD0_PACTA|nr:hypothetical protein PACTADRAFT_33899 [Pachysolen tannophilus NRRL Y-2460]
MGFLQKKIEDIIVIGAGPCGAAFTKFLLAEGEFKNVKVLEKRSTTGGLWNYSEQFFDSPVPSIDPSISTNAAEVIDKDFFLQQQYINDVAHFSHETRIGKDYIWPSAVYDQLDTNVPKDIMAFKNTPWPENYSIFPERQQVLKYFQEYSKIIEPYIEFGRRVIDVKQLPNSKWAVTSRPVVKETEAGFKQSNLKEFQDRIEFCDAVVVATGYYDVPFLPEKPGLQEWINKFPGSVIHAVSYRSPKQFSKNENILVVGNSASGGDLAFQLATNLNKKIYKSFRSESNIPAGKHEKIINVPDIKKFNYKSAEIEFVDGSSIANINKIIFATGYLKSLPFFKEINNSSNPLITDGQRVHGLYRQLLSYNYAGLAIAALPRLVLPTRLAETQGSWVAKVWSGKIPIPSRQEMLEWEQNRVKQMGNDKKFHDLAYPDDIIYSNELNNEIKIAKTNCNLYPVEWDEEQIRIKAAIKEIKDCYVDYRVRTGYSTKSIKELQDKNGLILPEIDWKIFDKKL